MLPKTDGEYQKLLTEVIKKQIIVLGPDITLAKARNVPGLSVADDGTITAISGDPQQITQKLIEQFMELSGQIVKKTMEPLLANYPGFMPQTAAQQPAVQQPIPAPQPKPTTQAQVQPAQTAPAPIAAPTTQQPPAENTANTNTVNPVETS
ncbi:MAG: hypothetical protein Q8P80_01555 [Candidatus Levybacteria bacterium]|nr:hypothetical protein [Candidatus Levybacteria bacterium]